ncbi:hypothetical protein WA158_006655 [Blastocystis sp. Blastoise]
MSDTNFHLTDNKYLFSFQDETKLWISKEFIEKYQQLPFYDIIEHSEKYEDGSYYLDILPFHIEKVISFLMDKNMDISSLNLRDSYDIYCTLVEYPAVISNEQQSDLLFHVKQLFANYLKENSYDVYDYFDDENKLQIPMILFSSNVKKIYIQRLFSQQQKDDLLYYSLLFKMMNVIEVEIEYDYASNIPLEYICPKYIKEIFPSLEELKIIVTTNYKKTELLLNPNTDEYIREYIHLFNESNYKKNKSIKYEYYTESEMNEYNKISSLDLNKIYYSHDLIDSYNKKREKNELPKLYKYIVNEAIYTKDYSKLEISKTEDEYTLDDEVSIKYDDKTNDKKLFIDKISSEYGMSQLLSLSSYCSISKIILDKFRYLKSQARVIMKLFEKGVFDSLTVLNVESIKKLTNEIDYNLFYKLITSHVFPNVIELIYDYNYERFQLSLLKKECFPKLHIINYRCRMNTDNFKSIFPENLISIIDTIHIHDNFLVNKEIVDLVDLACTYSIHIDINDVCKIRYSDFENIKKLDYFVNCKQNINWLDITLTSSISYSDDPYQVDKRNSLERFLNSNVLQYLNQLNVSFDKNKSIEYLTWISTLFNNNKFNTIHGLTINLRIKKDSSSEYLTAYENIMEKLIPKAFIVTIQGCTMSFINRLVHKGCFHNTTQLNLSINGILDNSFYQVLTTDNFHQLKYIKFFYSGNEEYSCSFIKKLFKFIHNNNFPSLSTIVFYNTYDDSSYTYNPDTSIPRCKYDSNSFIDKIISTDNIYDEEQLSKLIKFITIGKIPKLKEFIFWLDYDISDEKRNIYKQQLNDSAFIKENHKHSGTVDTKYERTFKDENGAELQYISPVGAILFKIQNSEPFIVNVDVSITHEFSYNHVILLIVGFILLIAAYYISHSHLFLYASSATLTVLLSSCLLFYFIYKRLNINKKTVGLLSVLSSIGLGSFIKQLLTQTTTNYISQYYPYLIGYVVLTAIIGIVIMYLYMPDSKAKSLNVLNAFLAGIGFLLLCSASPSVTMSVIVAVSIVLFKCFSSLIIPFLNKQLVLLYWGFRYRFWKTKKVYKTIEEYEDEGYQMTIQQMNELIHKFAAHPELMNKLDPKTVNILQKMCQGEYSYNYYISQQENGWVDKEHQQITADIDDDDNAMDEITVTPATTNNSNNNNSNILSRRPDFKLYPQAN